MSSAESQGVAFRLPVWSWLALWMGAWVGVPVAAHHAMHGVVNGWQVALAFFLAINLLICGWEISLWHRIDDIRRWFHMPKGTEDRPRGNLYTTPVSLRSTRISSKRGLQARNRR